MNLSHLNVNTTKLDLSKLNLKRVPEQVFACKRLRSLNLSHNQLTELPKELSELSYLKNLDVSNNKIAVLYAKMFELKRLESLLLNRNRLKRLPEQIERLINIKKLSIANNEIQVIPKILQKLVGLTSFDLTGNKMRRFPEEIFQLENLKRLWIGGNDFSSFESERLINQLPKLRHLYCFTSVRNAVPDFDNDYHQLQRIKGNCIDSLHLLAKATTFVEKINSKKMDKHIFISYSHKDKEYKDEVEISLRSLRQLGYDFEFWSDTQLKGGDTWLKEIRDSIQRAGVAINIISRYYMASDLINKEEIPPLLLKAKQDGTLILNLIAKPCLFHETVWKDFQAVNDPSEPLQALSAAQQQTAYTMLERRILDHFKNGN